MSFLKKKSAEEPPEEIPEPEPVPEKLSRKERKLAERAAAEEEEPEEEKLSRKERKEAERAAKENKEAAIANTVIAPEDRPGRKEIEKYLEYEKMGMMDKGTKRTEATIDAIIQENAATVSEAMKRWAVTGVGAGSVETVCVNAPRGDKFRIGVDGKLRGMEYVSYVFGFTPSKMLVLVKNWNIVDNDTEYQTKEFYYSDITSTGFIEKNRQFAGKILKTNKLNIRVGYEEFTTVDVADCFMDMDTVTDMLFTIGEGKQKG